MRHRSAGAALCLLVASALPLRAQSSQFGIRGIGLPIRPLSVRSTATGGSFGLFDHESSFNPAAIGIVNAVLASFQTVQSWRKSESPAGTASAKDNRYPGVFVTGPIGGTPFAISLGASTYSDRNFTIESQDTLIIRDEQVITTDTLASTGGVSDLRAGIAWRRSRTVQFGLGFHLLTGSNRILSARHFSDTSYARASERFTVSYLGAGISAGIVARAGKVVTLAGMVRADNQLHVERDREKVGSTHLPMTFSGGARFQVGEKLQMATAATYRTWSRADDDVVAQGGVGATNTTEFSLGFEYLRDLRRPGRWPLRIGAYHAELPFPLTRGQDLTETGVSIGTATRFVGDRAGFDFSLTQLWRRGGSGFKERATLLTVGITVRPP